MRKVFILFAFVFTSTTIFAQGLELGLKAGVNFANLTDASNLDGRTGFVFGAFVGGKLGDKMGIQADLLYSQQGAEFDGDKIDLNYVNVPVVLKYFLTDNIHIHAGPQFGFIVDDNVTKVFNDFEEDVESNNFDLSGIVGVGIDLPMGIRLDGRYNFGLSKVVSSRLFNTIPVLKK